MIGLTPRGGPPISTGHGHDGCRPLNSHHRLRRWGWSGMGHAAFRAPYLKSANGAQQGQHGSAQVLVLQFQMCFPCGVQRGGRRDRTASACPLVPLPQCKGPSVDLRARRMSACVALHSAGWLVHRQMRERSCSWNPARAERAGAERHRAPSALVVVKRPIRVFRRSVLG